jgi:cysteine desulfuration protein SufE
MTKLDEIAETFELLGDWEQRYQYLIELGEQLPAMPDELKTEDNRVKACMSKVWLLAYNHDGRIRYHGDCDTSVIKGVLALLIGLCNDQSAKTIQTIDMDEIFKLLQLDEHLSPNRHIGVYAMFDLMKQQALKVDKASQAA